MDRQPGTGMFLPIIGRAACTGWAALQGLRTARMVAMAELQTAHTAELDAATLTAARALLYDVFDDMTDHDWEHAGSIHAGTRTKIRQIGGSARGYLAVGGPLTSPGTTYWMVARSVYLYIVTFGVNVRICRGQSAATCRRPVCLSAEMMGYMRTGALRRILWGSSG